jgi:hypothetical protein
VPRNVIELAAWPTCEHAVAFMQVPTACATDRATEPRALSLPTSEGPLLLELHHLCLAVVDDGDLQSAQATDTQHWVVFQELVVLPFSRPTCPESCDHNRERSLVPLQDFDISSAPLPQLAQELNRAVATLIS